MSTAALILAAGSSRRLGRPKQLEVWGETNLLGHVVGLARTFPVEEIWVVLGHQWERILKETDLEGVGVIENPEWEEGIASSIRVGLDAPHPAFPLRPGSDHRGRSARVITGGR